MKTTSIYTLFFSPTGTSRKIAAAVAQGMTETEGTATEESSGHNADTAQAPSSGQVPGAGPAAAAAPEPAAGNGGETKSMHGEPTVTAIDLTHPAGPPAPLPGEAVAIFAVPVYGGHVAPAALERLREIRGEGTPAVVLAVYGNRSFGTAVAELASFVAGRGFVPVAAGAFVGEHSYSTPETPIAQGRPDARDLAAATAFGAQVREKLAKTGPSSGRNPETASDTAATARATQTGSMDAAKAPATGALVPIDPAKLREPRTPLLPKLRFIRFVLGYRRRQKRNPVVLLPEGDAARCTQCGRCVALCPTQAIARGDELHTDPARCIRCCACVKGCAFGARTFRTPFAAALARNFVRQKPPVTLL
ncbi:4Fe-4S dicluster domain-containing protein [Alistipes onderdonkii]|uniref:4Fe-4S ferredoxin n=1 Tax=Alistipes onderdonkii TaxID=328813 RepID=A0A1Y3R1G4_9BACT|nr:4Fe-4S dicluster domain-containing protein [Alistipes onderdonkii]OUN04467.1 4Fe-4S ferredoxin [Alistipes onderdonkii]